MFDLVHFVLHVIHIEKSRMLHHASVNNGIISVEPLFGFRNKDGAVSFPAISLANRVEWV